MKKMKKKGNSSNGPEKRRKTLREKLTENKPVTIVYVVLRVLVMMVMVAQFFNGNFENVFLCVLTLFLFTLPSFIERTIRIDVPDTLEIIILLFIFSAEILGEIRAYYIQFPYWDTMLHTLNGFLCAAIGFSLVDILNRSGRFSFSLSPLYLAVAAFCFSMTVGVLWEFFEWGMDNIFFLDMQKDTVVHAISTVMLDPTGGNHPPYHRCDRGYSRRFPTGSGPWRIPGYRHQRHHEGPVCEFHWCGGVLLYRLFLC